MRGDGVRVVVVAVGVAVIVGIFSIGLVNVPDAPVSVPAVTVTAEASPAVTVTRTVEVRASRSKVRHPVRTVKPKRMTRATTLPTVSRNGGVWSRLSRCESGGRLHMDEWNGGQHVHGLYSMDYGWFRHFRIDPFSASDQLRIARYVLARQGPSAWPVCGPRAGLRSGS